MKNLYTIFASALLLCGGALLYAETSDENVIFDQTTSNSGDWKVFAATGNSGSTFTVMTSQIPPSSPTDNFSYSTWNYSETTKNLWLSSPAVTMTEGTNYNIDLLYQTWTNFKLENFEIYIVDAQVTDQTSANNMASAKPVYTATNITANKNEWYPISVEGVSGNGIKYIVFHASGACQGRFSIANVKLYSTAPATPKALAPTDLTAEAASDGTLEVTLNWTLPTKNDADEALTDANAITDVCVYRDDEKIATVAGAATTFIDTEATGLTAGAHTYAVSVVATGAEGAKSETASVAWAGPWSYSEKTLTVDNSSPATAWTYSQTSTSAYIRSNSATPLATLASNSVQLWASSNIDPYEAYISSPQLNIIAGRSYKISFYYRFNPNAETVVGGLEGYISTARASESAEAAQTAMTSVKVLDVNAAAGTITTNTPWQLVEFKGYQATSSPIYLNFHVSGPVCKGLYITALTIEEYTEKPFAPAAPTSLTAKAAANQVLEVALNWSNPTKSSDGDAFTADQSVEEVYIYRDDYETPAVVLEGNVESFTDNAENGLTPGAHSYKVKAVVDGKVSDFSNEASVVYAGPVATQSLPWNPTVAGLTNDEFSVMWLSYCPDSYSLNWTNRPAGIFIMNSTNTTANSWLISAPIDFSKTVANVVNYKITSTASGFTPEVYIGIVDSTTPTSFIVSQKATIGADGMIVLQLPAASQSSAMREGAAASDYRLAIRDVTANPESSYNLILTSLNVAENQYTGINNVLNANADVRAIYDLTGRKLNKALGELPKGVYIVTTSAGSTYKVHK